jgi:hypothetical protein
VTTEATIEIQTTGLSDEQTSSKEESNFLLLIAVMVPLGMLMLFTGSLGVCRDLF